MNYDQAITAAYAQADRWASEARLWKSRIDNDPDASNHQKGVWLAKAKKAKREEAAALARARRYTAEQQKHSTGE